MDIAEEIKKLREALEMQNLLNIYKTPGLKDSVHEKLSDIIAYYGAKIAAEKEEERKAAISEENVASRAASILL